MAVRLRAKAISQNVRSRRAIFGRFDPEAGSTVPAVVITPIIVLSALDAYVPWIAAIFTPIVLFTYSVDAQVAQIERYMNPVFSKAQFASLGRYVRNPD